MGKHSQSLCCSSDPHSRAKLLCRQLHGRSDGQCDGQGVLETVHVSCVERSHLLSLLLLTLTDHAAKKQFVFINHVPEINYSHNVVQATG